MSIFNSLDSLFNSSKSDKLFSKLENSQYEYTRHEYPENLNSRIDGQGHSILFNIYETTGIKKASTSTKSVANSSLLGAISDAGTVVNKLKSSIFGSTSTSVRNRISGSDSTRLISDSILMYMPDNITSELSTNWDGTDLNNAWQIETLKALNNASLDLSDFSGDALKSFSDTVSKAVDAPIDALKAGGQIAIERGVFGDETAQAYSAATRRINNPHMEFLFKSVAPRTFSYNFKFTPKSASEAETCRRIIELFRTHAAPSLEETTSFGQYWQFPSEFDITFLSNGVENRFLNKVSTCALTNIVVDYTASGEWAALRDTSGIGAPPVFATMSLTFQELELMSRQRIEEGF